MIIMYDNWAVLIILFSLISMDNIPLGQLMISRPIVVGPLLGYIMGDPTAGFWIGSVIELFWVYSIPVGQVPLDVTTMTVVSVFWSLSVVNRTISTYAVALISSVPCGIISRYINIWLRGKNKYFSELVIRKIKSNDEKYVLVALIASFLLWYIKTFLFYVICIPAGYCFMGYFVKFAGPDIELAFSYIGGILPVLSFSTVAVFFFKRGGLSALWKGRPK